MKRREVIALFGCGAAWSVAARAEQRAIPVIGLLSGASLQTMREWVAAFHRGLADAGFAEDRNVVVEYRWAEGNNDRLAGLAMDLVHRKVDIKRRSASRSRRRSSPAPTRSSSEAPGGYRRTCGGGMAARRERAAPGSRRAPGARRYP